MIAALYVEKGGVYYGLPDVDPWDEERDARLYEGPWPVVAHPPCARWCRLAGFVEHVHGHKRGDDGGTFAAALEAVRKFGGVLEHPAHSDAWAHFGLHKPEREGWTTSLLDDGLTAYVEQGRYGMPAKKATWLYACGVEPADLRWGYTPDADGESGSNAGGFGGMDAWRDRWTSVLTQQVGGRATWPGLSATTLTIETRPARGSLRTICAGHAGRPSTR